MKVKCPSCSHSFTVSNVERQLASLPPTGGDYEFTETEENFNCPQCKKYLGAQVRRTLSGEYLKHEPAFLAKVWD